MDCGGRRPEDLRGNHGLHSDAHGEREGSACGLDETDRIRQINRTSAYTRLFEKPNPMMSGYDFLYAMSWQLDEKNTALAWVDWGEGTKPKAIWPVYYNQYRLKKIVGEDAWAMELTTIDGMPRLVRLEDVIILRQHYRGEGISGGNNRPIYDAITMAEASDRGLMDAIQEPTGCTAM